MWDRVLQTICDVRIDDETALEVYRASNASPLIVGSISRARPSFPNVVPPRPSNDPTHGTDYVDFVLSLEVWLSRERVVGHLYDHGYRVGQKDTASEYADMKNETG